MSGRGKAYPRSGYESWVSKSEPVKPLYDPFVVPASDRFPVDKGIEGVIDMICFDTDEDAMYYEEDPNFGETCSASEYSKLKRAFANWKLALNERADPTVWVNPWVLTQEEKNILVSAWVLSFYSRYQTEEDGISSDLMKSIYAVFQCTDEYWEDQHNILHCIIAFVNDNIDTQTVIRHVYDPDLDCKFSYHYCFLGFTQIEFMLHYRYSVLNMARDFLRQCALPCLFNTWTTKGNTPIQQAYDTIHSYGVANCKTWWNDHRGFMAAIASFICSLDFTHEPTNPC